MTSLPMIVAEELQCDWSKVRVEYASPNRNFRENNVYGDMSSVGSHSVKDSHVKMQQVGASARERLIAAAAARWSVAPAECTRRQQRRDPRRLRPHAALRRARRRMRRRSRSPPSRRSRRPTSTPSSASRSRASTCRSRSTARRNTPSIRACPAWSLPRSRPARCPAARSPSVDETPLQGCAGHRPGRAAAERRRRRRHRQLLARQAGAGASCSRNGTPAPPATTDSAQLRARLSRRGADRAGRHRAQRRRRRHGAAGARPRPSSAVYEVPYLAHAPMEPMNATVHLQADRLDVWVGTQSADRTLKAAADSRRAEARAGLYPQLPSSAAASAANRNNDEMAQAIQIAKVGATAR